MGEERNQRNQKPKTKNCWKPFYIKKEKKIKDKILEISGHFLNKKNKKIIIN